MIRHSIIFVAVSALLLSCSGKSESDSDRLAKAKADFERACSPCHDLDVPLRAAKGLDGWRDTVKRMKDKGAALTSAEAEEVAKYLASIRGK